MHFLNRIFVSELCYYFCLLTALLISSHFARLLFFEVTNQESFAIIASLIAQHLNPIAFM